MSDVKNAAPQDNSNGVTVERLQVDQYTKAELVDMVERLTAEKEAALEQSRWAPDMENANRPAIEEGPHLQDPELRAIKLDAMLKAGMTHEDEGLTDDMRTILQEGVTDELRQYMPGQED